MKNQKGYNKKTKDGNVFWYPSHISFNFTSHSTLDVPSPTFHFHSHFPQYHTHFAISILLHLLLLIILCMLSILLVLNHHFCSVPNNISLFSPSIHSSIYYLPFSFIIAYCYDVDPIDLILHPQKASSPFQSSFTIVVILVVVVKSG